MPRENDVKAWWAEVITVNWLATNQVQNIVSITPPPVASEITAHINNPERRIPTPGLAHGGTTAGQPTGNHSTDTPAHHEQWQKICIHGTRGDNATSYIERMATMVSSI